MQNKINFIALAAGISSLILIVVSMFVPWWQLTVGNPANIQVNISPVNFALSQSNIALPIPLFLALNIASILTMVAGGIILIIYSVKPSETYSRQLLGFGYKKPIYIVAVFAAILVALPIVMQFVAGFALPISGSALVTPHGGNGGASVSAVLEWPFYFAIVVAALSVAARLVHGKTTKPAVLPAPVQTPSMAVASVP